MAEFDPYSENYRELVTESVRASGEPSEYFAAHKAKYLLRKFGSGKIGSVLDYGCGVGALAEQLRSVLPEARIDGFDPSQGSLNRVPASLRRGGEFQSDLTQLPGNYDLVVMANVLHHVQPSARVCVVEYAFAKLRPEGRIVVFEHNPMNPLT